MKGWAKGEWRTFLDQKVMPYNDKKVIGVKKANEYATTTVVNEYFIRFFWALPLYQDPHSDDPPFVNDAELTEEQLAVKVAIIKQMSSAIPKWLDYHASKTSFLSRLSGVEGPRQRSLTAKQLFGKDNEDINRRFEASWTSRGGEFKDPEEFSKLLEETQKMWVRRAAKATEEIKKGKDSSYIEPTLLPPEEAQRVIDTLATYFGPLLEGGQVNVISLHEGIDKSPVPVSFDEGGGEKYKLWLAALGEWGMSCYTPDEQKARALPGVGVPSAPPRFLIPDPPWRLQNPVSGSASEPAEQGAASEDESDTESKTDKKKKRKKKAKGQKRGRETSRAEVEPEERRSKRKKGLTEGAETVVDASIEDTAPEKEVPQPRPPMRGNVVPPLHRLSLEDTNRIDLALLAGGVAPGTFILNCGPNDHPNPFGHVDPPQGPAQPDVERLQPEHLKPPRSAYMKPEIWPEWFTAA
ncbi:hypothetical protein EV421DRAFT_1903282 [Armillaria borealis]|uniref:Uncharacterized protein n=1 Tax=Armillaria borealis TaxID=47425 RepID=A0AA39JMQ7_9AGAR|nr:hypothetical protein EV421DRAFT_1903282 [Armillaria borealis]